MFKRAIILAGGKGTRLLPYTTVLPKPLMPIGEYTILELIIKQLANAGFERITLAVNHQAEIIKAYFKDGGKWSVKIDYSLENIPLSTMGPLKLIDDLEDNFLVMNGDILTDIDYAKFYEDHVNEKNLFTISSYLREQLVDYGVLQTSNNTLVNLKEKPLFSYEVSMGIYMMSKSVVKLIPNNTPYGFDNLMHDLVIKGYTVNVKKYFGYWLDIGRPSDYAQAIEEFEFKKDIFLVKK